MQKHFVFFHVGQETIFPTILVNSIKRTCEDSYIVQCSDANTPRIEGVDEYRIVEAEPNALMISRMKAFAGLNLDETAAYVDTDMIFVGNVDPEALLANEQVGVCRRYFENDRLINTSFRGMELNEYKGKSIGKVWPYIGCFTVTRNADFWRVCVEEYEKLERKFHFWYGDQEVLRNVIDRGAFEYRELPEPVYACLPERQGEYAGKAMVLHFKGPGRKKPMIDLAIRQGLIKLTDLF